MRVGQFTANLVGPHGGSEQYCLALARWLQERGHQSVVFTRDIDDSTASRLAALGIEVHLVPLRLPYAPGSRGGPVRKVLFHGLDLTRSFRPTTAARVFRDARLDVLHVHRWQGFGTGVLKIPRLPTVLTAHDFALLDSRTTLARDRGPLLRLPVAQRLRAALINSTLSRSLTVIYPTERTRRRHHDFKIHVNPSREHVVWHGWEIDDDPQSAASAEKSSVLFLGSLTEAKGIPLLLEAWGGGISGAELRIAGTGPLQLTVEKAAENTASIIPLGWITGADRARELRSSSLLVLPSNWPETFSLVSAEAILAGTPVVATERSAPDILSEQDSVVVPHTAEALRAALSHLLADEVALAQLRSGTASSASGFAVEPHVSRLVKIYEAAAR